MPRDYEIHIAFKNSIRVEASGRRTVSTVDFVSELSLLHHQFSLREANQWIEHYQSSFRDVSREEGERRIFQLFNPNGGANF
ncbi:DNA polymerase V [Pantoea coffeiphila]|uniref:DNA polymerase V n=1 Tax=Pantoea coffeiphila TaxID=1465635 RepID=A0A2S9I8B0_9GAMM|nr:DNA polymerase V [Pantoea coffeiphila]PRD13964.1 DNA polymerase V [Pantoea coffeiphila]